MTDEVQPLQPAEPIRRKWYEKFQNFVPISQKKTVVLILTRNYYLPVTDWSKMDVDIILGLHEEKRSEKKSLAVFLEEITEADFKSQNALIQENVLRGILNFKNDLLKGAESEIIQQLNTTYPNAVSVRFSDAEGDNGHGEEDEEVVKDEKTAARLKQNFTYYGNKLADLFWVKRNPPEKAAVILFPLAGAFVLTGSLTSHVGFLMTASNAVAKILPTAFTTFANTHAIPPLAIGCYAVAGVLALTALILLLASFYQKHKAKQLAEPTTSINFPEHERVEFHKF